MGLKSLHEHQQESTLDSSQELNHLLYLHIPGRTWVGSRAEPSPYPMLFAFTPAATGYREVIFKCPRITGCYPACNWSPVTVSTQQ